MMATDVKIVLYGKMATGKSSMVERYKKDTFEASQEATIGAAFCTATLFQDGIPIKAQIWDTAGMEKFKSIVPMYLRGATVVMFCFDIPLLDDIREGIKFIRSSTLDARIVLVQTKIDKYKSNLYNEDLTNQLNIFVEREGYKIFYTSSKTGHSVKELFDYCITTGNKLKKPLPNENVKLKTNEKLNTGCCVIN
jgi:Ras-related protein Rab-5C